MRERQRDNDDYYNNDDDDINRTECTITFHSRSSFLFINHVITGVVGWGLINPAGHDGHLHYLM